MSKFVRYIESKCKGKISSKRKKDGKAPSNRALTASIGSVRVTRLGKQAKVISSNHVQTTSHRCSPEQVLVKPSCRSFQWKDAEQKSLSMDGHCVYMPTTGMFVSWNKQFQHLLKIPGQCLLGLLKRVMFLRPYLFVVFLSACQLVGQPSLGQGILQTFELNMLASETRALPAQYPDLAFNKLKESMAIYQHNACSKR